VQVIACEDSSLKWPVMHLVRCN